MKTQGKPVSYAEVLSLKTYIEHTKSTQTGQLFISPNNKGNS